MSKIIDYLTQLNVPEAEGQLYLKLLSSGITTVSDLARSSGIKRTTAYLHIDALINKGLAMRIVRGTKKFIAPTEPEDLEIFIEKKSAQIHTLRKDLPEMLQMIQHFFSQNENTKDIEIKVYKGRQGARKIYEEAFMADEVRSYATVNIPNTLYLDDVLMFDAAFKKNKKLVWREFVYGPTSSTTISEKILTLTDRYFYKFMPNVKLSSQDILIYDGKVAIIDCRPKGTSIVLQSQDFYSNLKELFDFSWKSFSDSPTIKTYA